MNQGTYPLAAAMINQLNRVDMISNNLANANTTGFKQEGLSEGSFNYYLKKAEQEKQEPLKVNEVTNTIPKIDTKYIDASVGSITPTGNSLDFALKHPDTFFKVKSSNGEILLTRDGSFHILNNKLLTANGNEVLNNNNEPIGTEEGDFGRQIAIVQTSFENLEKKGDNNYSVKSETDIKNIFNNETYAVQGALEKSNVNSIKAMVALIDSHRRFEQAQKAVMGIDEINSKVIDKIGDNK